MISALLVSAAGIIVLGLMVHSLVNSSAALKTDLTNTQQMLDMALLNRKADAAFIKRLAAESEQNRYDAERYRLVRYYIEHDHGELAIEAFYGPQSILSASALDSLLDEELDAQYHLANDNA
jgi:hypothetical protein